MGRRRLYYGWTILAVATLAVFMSRPGQTYVAAVFVDPIQRDTGVILAHQNRIVGRAAGLDNAEPTMSTIARALAQRAAASS